MGQELIIEGLLFISNHLAKSINYFVTEVGPEKVQEFLFN